MTKPVILFGAGGHALVLLDTLEKLGVEIKAITAPRCENEHVAFSKYARHEQDEAIDDYDVEDVILVNGLGQLPYPNHTSFSQSKRFKLYEAMKNKGYTFLTVISADAVVSPYAILHEGVQIMAGVVVQAGAEIGINTIINTGACIDHGCIVGAYNHISPSACLSGDVVTDDWVHVATGAVVAQGVKIGQASTIGAGTSVVKNVPENCKIIPSKSIISRLD